MTGIIDTHAHLDDPWFLPRIDRVLEELRGKVVNGEIAGSTAIGMDAQVYEDLKNSVS